MKYSNIKKVLLGLGLIGGLLTAAATQAAGCDPNKGKKVFNRCAACHSMTEGAHMMGPSLAGMDGRKAGGAEGFTYSVAMEQADFAWTTERLDAFLKSPMTYVPGTSMPFAGLKKDKARADLVCYLLQH